MTPLKVEPLLAPCEPEDLGDLLQTPRASFYGDVELAEFLFPPADAQSADRSSTRQLIDYRKVLGEPQRIVEGGQDDTCAQLDALRDGGEGRKHRQHRRKVTVFGEVVFGDPRGIESGGFHELHHL